MSAVTPPLCWLAQRLGWPWLGLIFHMATLTDESPAGARKGVCNYIMTPNRLHAFRSFQCCQRTASPSAWSLMNGNDSAVLPRAEDLMMLWDWNFEILNLGCVFSTVIALCFCFMFSFFFVFYTNSPFWLWLTETFTLKIFKNLHWIP